MCGQASCKTGKRNLIFSPQKDICKIFIAQDFIILGHANLHLHKLHLGKIQSILGFGGLT